MAANNRIEINLGFRADITEAKKNIQDLQASLTQISNLKTNPGAQLNVSLQEATKSADILQQHLMTAMDIKTGNLNLTKFQLSLQQSGQSVAQLAGNLLNAGLIGEQAFTQLQNSIAMANIKITQSNTLLGRFATTLKNTAKWQISSTLLHGFMGAIQGAYGYAQDLNSSLNKIRIVTGQSVEQMDKFAEKANKAAQSLSASTLAYTDAALIFYQQGLDDKSVEERTNVTVKMMNVTGQSAEEVSSQMTAIWNNFDNGSESMEHYADVITRLGAETASSSSEIAEGLQKFSAVANTVGLSYEYATSALATVVAQTRQSADTVGTAFKTLFARIQDLELGETLDDGTTLGKYSQALATIGVNIKDVNGEVKNMDQILNDLGSKWGSLSKDVQEATAQTVAGTRQYANFLALMDNWDAFQNNLSIAKTSDGTLEEQAKIYEESWEASSKRVKASLQELYSNIVDDKFFINLNDGLAKLINGITQLMDGLGGVKGILYLISTTVLNKIGPQIANYVDLGINKLRIVGSHITSIGTKIKTTFIDGDWKHPISSLSTIREKLIEINKENALKYDIGKKMLDDLQKEVELRTDLTPSFKIQQEGLLQIRDITDSIKKSNLQLTEVQQEFINGQNQELLNLNNKRAILKEEEEILQQEKNDLLDLIRSEELYSSSQLEVGKYDGRTKDAQGKLTINTESKEELLIFKDLLTNIQESYGKIKFSIGDIDNGIKLSTNSMVEFEALFGNLGELIQNFEQYGNEINQIFTKMPKNASNVESEVKKILKTINNLPASMKNFIKSLAKGAENSADFKQQLMGSKQQLIEMAKKAGMSEKTIKNLVSNGGKIRNNFNDSTKATDLFNQKLNAARNTLLNLKAGSQSFGTSFTQAAQGASSVAMGVNAVHNAIETLKNEDASVFEKMTATTMGLTMGLQAIAGAGKLLSGTWGILLKLGSGLANRFSEMLPSLAAKIALTKADQNATLLSSLAQKGKLLLDQKDVSIQNIKSALMKKGLKDKAAQIVAEKLFTGAQAASTVTEEGGIVVDYKKAASGWAALGPALLFVAIGAAIVAALVGITALIINLANAETEEEKAAREANEQLEEQKEALARTKEYAQNLYDDFNKYKDVVKILQECTKGTKEWNDAFENVLDNTYKLIEKYPELLKYNNLFNVNGTLNEKVLDEILQFAQNSEKTLQNSVTKAEINKMIADNNLQYSNITNEITKKQTRIFNSDSNDKGNSYTFTEQDSDKALSEILASGIDLRNQNAQNAKELINKELHNIFSEEDFTEYEKAISQLTEGIIESKDSIIELGNNAKSTAIALNNTAKLVTQNMFQEELQNDSTKTIAYMQAINNYRQQQEDVFKEGRKYAKDKVMGSDDDIETMKGKKGGKQIIEAFDEYKKMQGKNEWQLVDDDAIIKRDGVKYFQYYTDKTKKEKEKVAIDVVFDDAIESKVINAKEKIEKMAEDIYENNYQGLNTAGLSFLADENFMNANIKSLKELKQSQQGLEAFGLKNDDDIKNFLATKYGVDLKEIDQTRIDDFKEKYQQEMNIALKELNKVPKFIQDQMGDKLINNLDIGQIEKVGKLYTDTMANAGKAGVNLLNAIAESAGEDGGQVLAALTDMGDLSALGADEVNKRLKDLGYNIVLTDNQIATWSNNLQGASKKTIESAQETYKSVSKILNNLKSIGSTIEKESYDSLISLDDSLKSYFTQMADGTYMLTKNADEFKQKVQTISLASLEEAAEQARENSLAYSNASNLTLNSDYNFKIKGQTVDLEDWDSSIGKEQGLKFLDETKTMISILEQGGQDVSKYKAQLEETGFLWGSQLKSLTESYEDYAQINKDSFSELANQANEEAYAAQEAIKTAKYQFAVSNAGLDLETTENYAKVLQQVYAAEDMTEGQARNLAIANQRLDNGLSKLNDNVETWRKNLLKNNQASAEYAATLKEVRTSFADILNLTSGDGLSSTFIENVIGDKERLKKILDGDAATIQKFRQDALDELFKNYKIEDMFNNLDDVLQDLADLNPNMDWIQDLKNNLNDLDLSAAGLKKELNNLGEGTELSPDYTNALNAMLASGLITENQLNDIFQDIGYKPVVTTEYIEQESLIPQYKTLETVTKTSKDGVYPETYEKISETVINDYKKMPQKVAVTQIATNENGSGSIDIVNAGTKRISASYSATKSGKTSKNDSDKKKNTDEIDRYHTINKQIESQNKELERLSKVKEKAWGTDKLAAMNAESEAIQREIGLQKQLLRETEIYLDMDRPALSAYGAVFDEFGNIVNYTEIMQQQLDKYNSELTDDAEEAYEKFKKVVSNYEDSLAKNVEAQEAVQEAYDKLEENWKEQAEYIVDFKIKAYDSVIDILDRKINRLGDDAADAAEKIGLIGQKINTLGKNANAYIEGASNLVYAHVLATTKDENYANTMRGKIQNGTITSDELRGLGLSEDDMQQLQDYLSNAQEATEQMRESALESFDILQNAFDLGAEEFDKSLEKIDHAKSLLDNYTKIADVLGAELLGDIDKFNLQAKKTSAEIASSRIGVVKNSLETYQQELIDANKALTSALASGDAEQEKRAKEIIESIENKIQEATEDLYSSAAEAAEAFRALYEEQVDQAIKEMEKTFTGGKSFDIFESDFEYANEVEERFLPAYQKMYELNKLQRDLNKSLSDTDSLSGKKALLEVQEKINAAQAEGVELTEYDLENLRREYELKLAQNQLEEAQNAKDTVRMTKNSEGNWAYVYTANEDNIAKAEQNYEDKLYSMQSANEKYLKELQNNIIKAQKDYLTRIKEIRLDNSLAEDEKRQLESQAYQQFMERINYNSNQMQNVFQNNTILQNEDLEFYKKYLNSKSDYDNAYLSDYIKLTTKFEQTILSTETDYKTLEEYQINMEQAVSKSLLTMDQAYIDYQSNVKTALNKCGISLEDYARISNEKMQGIVKDVKSVETESTNLKNAVTSDFSKVSSEVGKLLTTFNTDFPAMEGKVQSLINKVTELVNATANDLSMNVTVNFESTGDQSIKNIVYDRIAGTEVARTKDDDNFSPPESERTVSPIQFLTSDLEQMKNSYQNQSIKITYQDEGVMHKRIVYAGGVCVDRGLYPHVYPKNNNNLRCVYCGHYFKAPENMQYKIKTDDVYDPKRVFSYFVPNNNNFYNQPGLFDTGGYTGEWGNDSGRLAILHEKELVLNKQDTANILTAVDMVRKLNNQITNMALSSQLSKLDSLNTNFTSNINLSAQPLEQNVHITAEFPGVQDRNEIEEAFNTLINQTSQYINRYNY